MKIFCYFIVIFFVLVENVFKIKQIPKNPLGLLLGAAIYAIVIFSCAMVAMDLALKIGG